MNDQTYNGWTNYATWRVNLEVFDGLNLRDHFDELPETYEVGKWACAYAEELIDAALDGFTKRNRWTNENLTKMLGPCDIVDGWSRAFLSEVDWHMIASHLIENASEVDA